MKKPLPNRITVTGDNSDNTLNGTSGDDLLLGLGGNDILNGLGGIDRTEGGTGDDWHYVDNAADIVVELSGEGNDRVLAGVSYALAAGVSVEKLTTDNNSGAGLINLTGNELVNEIYGNNATNYIDGKEGSDSLYGLGGFDYFVFTSPIDTGDVDTINDLVSSPTLGARDRVLLDNTIFTGLLVGLVGHVSGNTPLGYNPVIIDVFAGGIHNIYFDQDGEGAAFQRIHFATIVNSGAGSLSNLTFEAFRSDAPSNVIAGDGGDNSINGTAGADTLEGLGGNDILNGGAGIDRTRGGAGDDLHYVDRSYDLVEELAGEGNDTVLTSVSYQLDAGASVETLATTSDAGTTTINLLGNALGQTIRGNDGANIIDGKGGADILAGLGGNDFYIVDANSAVQEQAGGGIDTVLVNGDSSWVATAGSEIEVIRIARGTGAGAAANVTGNALAQTICGDGKGNIIDGGGGGDILYGLDPANSPGQTDFTNDNDQFYVDTGDQVIERVNEGYDRVFARTSYTLTAGSYVEQLTTDYNNGTAAINLTGNELAQGIYGNAGANIIDGQAGNDDLYGFGGADGFAFTSAYGPGNIDWIHDFVAGTDKILLGNGTFGLALGALPPEAFRAGTAAQDADDRVIYDSATGALYFDEDGSGTTFGQTQFAVVNAGLALTATDFIVIEGGVGPTIITGDNGDNTLNGTAGNDLLQGLGGNDILIGGAGFDRSQGGSGDDWHYIDSANDVVEEFAGEGNDRVLSAVSYTLRAGLSVEKLTTDWNPGTAAINLTGNELAQEIYGNAGANILDGKGGADFMAGLQGDDWFYVDDVADVVFETAGGGNDRIFSSVSYTLAAGLSVEKLTTDWNSGTTAINLTGNELKNAVYGNDGDNIIDGGGGGDELAGLGGNDQYFVSAGDTVIDSAGFNRVWARTSFTLASNALVQHFTTADRFGTQAINLTGNGGAQEIYGNSGDNRIDDGGGFNVSDGLYGLEGNDTYVLRATGSGPGAPQDALSRVYEAVGGGFDTVLVNAPQWVAIAGSEIEVVRATYSSNCNLTGNAFSQTIYGNSSKNILDGGGGGDTLYGTGDGADRGSAFDLAHDDDQYFVDTGDHVIELAGLGWAGEGVDRVWARTSYTLDAGSWIEQLTTANHTGTAAINLTGNELYQAIYGNAGDNVIDGKGSSDELFGLAGADSFAFTSALGPGNIDGIYDYAVGTDRILLDDAVFTGLATGALASSAFVAGTAALDADDRIIFDQATGRIWFDRDGNGSAFAAVQFAFIDDGQTLTASDFTVI